MRISQAPLALLLLPSVASAQTVPGQIYEITSVSDMTEQGPNGSSGSSHDQDMLVERVISVGAAGMELGYDLPKSASKAERASVWQFPVRIFKPSGGPMQLLDVPAMEARVDAWLKKAKWPRSACGTWYFTWNAFRIECDPQSVIETLGVFDMRPGNLRDGAMYREKGALAAAPLRRQLRGSGGQALVVEMSIDPEQVRREKAEADVVIGEITHKPVTLEAALAAHRGTRFSGTITTTFEIDAGGEVSRRTTLTKLETLEPDGSAKSRTTTRIVERRRISH